jgi:alkylation response protein AidB-like acyl-CoA dehydrogenase
VRATELQQTLTELALEASAYSAFPFTPEFARDGAPGELNSWSNRVAANYFNTRKVTIYGGSSEIQKNIMAKAVLGL